LRYTKKALPAKPAAPFFVHPDVVVLLIWRQSLDFVGVARCQQIFSKKT